MTDIDINRADFYRYSHDAAENKRTKERLTQLVEIGAKVVGVAEFGIKNVFSGLYIERVWHFNDEEWDDYMTWIKQKQETK